MSIRTLLGALAVSAIAVVAMAFVQDAAPTQQPGPFVSFIGADSAVDARRYVKVTTEEQWAALWLEHTSQPRPKGDYGWYYNPGKVPVVDFGQCLVVGVFQGDRWNSAGVKVVEVLAGDDRLVVRFDDKSFQTAGPDGGGVKARPFGLFVLPRSARPIVLEENVQGLIGKPPKWKERATL